MRQPESPAEIVSVDFNGSQLVIEEGNLSTNFALQHNSVFTVRNRSDQTLERIDLRVSVGVCPASATRLGPSWSGRLLPGETTRIQVGRGTSGGTGSSMAGAGPIAVWAWVDRVDFAGCAYRPAQILPQSLCQDVRPGIPTSPR